MPTPRIGAVAYLNTRPLVHGLERDAVAGRVRLEYHVPARLAERMREGALDIALIPVVGLADQPDLELVPGLGIVTRGAARSVLLVSRVPFEGIRRLALDPESRTSNVLARVLLDARHGVRPVAEPGPLDLGDALDGFDAAIRIGDKALFEEVPAHCRVMDLGAAWTEWHGLPFVFAAWFARPGVVDRETYRMLHASRREGRAAIDAIAANYAWADRRDPQLAAHYLRHHIHNRLGSPEIEAMRRFFTAAERLGLIDAAPEIRLALTRWTTCHETAAHAARNR